MKRNITYLFCSLIISGFLLFLTNSCEDNGDITETIKVGVLLGHSGTGSQNAIETKAALDICMEDINDYIQSNGLEVSVELFFEDTKSDTNEAKIKAQVLIDKGVSIIIGPYTSAEAKAVKSIAAANNVLLVSHSAVSTSLASPDDNLLRFAPCDLFQAEAINAMFTDDSIKAIVAIVRNDLWSNSLIGATKDRFENNGGVVVSQQAFEPGNTDFSTLAANVKTQVDAAVNLYGVDKVGVYIISYADGAYVLEALSDVNLLSGIKIYGASAFAQSSALIANPKAAEFAFNSKIQCPIFGFDEAASNIYDPIQTRIKSVIGKNASVYSLAAYDILWVSVLSSLTQQAKADFASFKAHFIETAGLYYGATGRTELDDNGDRKHVYYDFWSVDKINTNYSWKLSAKYNTTGQILTKY